MKRGIVAVALLGAWASLAAAVGEGESSGVAGPDAIGARQASLDMSSITFHSMGESIKAGHEAKTLSYPAAALAKWAKALPTMFPPGTGEGETPRDTQARAEIWEDRPGFERAAANYAAATTELAALAKANDTRAFTKQLLVVDQACHACHSHYKDGPK